MVPLPRQACDEVQHHPVLDPDVRDQDLAHPGEHAQPLVDQAAGEDHVGAVLAQAELLDPLAERQARELLDHRPQALERQTVRTPASSGSPASLASASMLPPVAM